MQSNEPHDKEGFLRKRGGRMLRWTQRYFVLNGSKISYKLKADSPSFRDEFDLAPGCIVTEITEDHIGTISGRKIFSFWLVWPHDKHHKYEDDKRETTAVDDSDDEDDTNKNESKSKHLKEIIESKHLQQINQQHKVKEQIDRHVEQDKYTSVGLKVGAAVAIGGIVVGALSGGIGIAPYFAAVAGIAAATGSGVVAVKYGKPSKRPFDSRLVLACDTMNDAVSWKLALEHQISQLEKLPCLPPSADPNVISSIIGLSQGTQNFHVVNIVESVRLLEVIRMDRSEPQCMKGHIVVKCSPFATFLTLMDSLNWPKQDPLKVVHTVDDHTDILSGHISTTRSPCVPSASWTSRLQSLLPVTSKKMSYPICLSRFWKSDDDGVYLISLNSTEFRSDWQSKKELSSVETLDNFNIDAVIIIAPRKDQSKYTETLVKCIIQVTNTRSDIHETQVTEIMEEFLIQHLIELYHTIYDHRYHNRLEQYTLPTLNTVPEGASTTPPTRSPRSPRSRWSITAGSPHLPSDSTNEATEGGNMLPPPQKLERSSSLTSYMMPSRLNANTSSNVVRTESAPADVSPPPKKRYLFGRTKKTNNNSTGGAASHTHDDSYLYSGSSGGSHSHSAGGGGGGGAIMRTNSNPSDPHDPSFNLSIDAIPVSDDLDTTTTPTNTTNAKGSPSKMSKNALNKKISNIRSEIATREYQLKRVANNRKKALHRNSNPQMQPVSPEPQTTGTHTVTSTATTSANTKLHLREPEESTYNTTTSATNNASSNQRANSDDLQVTLLNEIEHLKKEYYELTGTEYENHPGWKRTRRYLGGTLSRSLRSLPTSSTTSSSQPQSNTGSSSLPHATAIVSNLGDSHSNSAVVQYLQCESTDPEYMTYKSSLSSKLDYRRLSQRSLGREDVYKNKVPAHWSLPTRKLRTSYINDPTKPGISLSSLSSDEWTYTNGFLVKKRSNFHGHLSKNTSQSIVPLLLGFLFLGVLTILHVI